MLWPGTDGFEPVPDWRLDRLAIRVALYGREKLGVEPGGRVALFGRLGWVWPVVDFAAMGFGALPVGIEDDASDAVVTRALADATPRVIFASDSESAERLQAIQRDGGAGDATIVAEGLARGESVVPLEEVLEKGSILDTAERAQSFRAVSRQISPQSDALWHFAGDGVTRLTHAEAMARIVPMLRSRPAVDGDVAYLSGPRTDLATRLALAAFVGDGRTTTALGQGDPPEKDVQALRPHKMIVPASWLEAACRDQGPRWPGGLDRPWARRRLLERLGDRLRWVETPYPVSEATARALQVATVSAHVAVSGADRQETQKDTAVVH
jgi:hypothetical protein